ncbi:MAG TPA: TonB C-terminal domain-containing protein [Gemmatimonadaceae bacterium]|nr:TonB C-terminal domain-containing protein [Gemmatimonadaceae bacterium]
MRMPPQSLKLPIVSSAILHAVVLGLVVLRGVAPKAALPPMYRVQLVAAPPGPRAEGVVTDRAAPETPTKAPPAPERTKAPPPRSKVAPRRPARPAPKAATPNVTKSSRPQATKAPPKAGGGAEGGSGSDVANVNTAGIDFPYEGYLRNIVRQIALAFETPRGAVSFRAEVTFLIHRDGSVSGIRLLTPSGSYVFDQNCLTAVEATGRAKRFGPLPEGFTDDVLPVIFSFDPRTLR